jgi:hypothetical protein
MFAPIARMDTIRFLFVVAAYKNWKVFQLDVKLAFLNGILQEEIYVEQPAGFVIQGKEDKVYLLKKALYGLKQTPRAWYSRIDDYLTGSGFQKSLSEATLYVKRINDDVLIISLYIDDLLVTGSNIEQVEKFKQNMMQVFEMTNLGLMSFFSGNGNHTKQRKSIHLSEEIFKGNLEEIPYGELQIDSHSNESKGKI